MKCATTGKIRYPDAESARAVQTRLGHKVDPYRCPDCDGWHLGGHHRRRKGDVLAQYRRNPRLAYSLFMFWAATVLSIVLGVGLHDPIPPCIAVVVMAFLLTVEAVEDHDRDSSDGASDAG